MINLWSRTHTHNYSLNMSFVTFIGSERNGDPIGRTRVSTNWDPIELSYLKLSTKKSKNRGEIG